MNMHRINDMIMSDNAFTACERVVAYFTIHRARGEGRHCEKRIFWWSALKIEQKIGISRKTTANAWKKMEERGWISDSGKRIGRAKVWEINVQSLWNHSQLLVNNFAQIEEPLTTNSLKELPQELSQKLTQSGSSISEDEIVSRYVGFGKEEEDASQALEL